MTPPKAQKPAKDETVPEDREWNKDRAAEEAAKARDHSENG